MWNACWKQWIVFPAFFCEELKDTVTENQAWGILIWLLSSWLLRRLSTLLTLLYYCVGKNKRRKNQIWKMPFPSFLDSKMKILTRPGNPQARRWRLQTPPKFLRRVHKFSKTSRTLAPSPFLFQCFLFDRATSVFSERLFNRLRPKKKNTPTKC